jgi:4a-hydroxytetrahydrobiopterin dehydratase
MNQPLSEDAILAALTALPGWAVVDGALERMFEFRGFPAALGFIVRVGVEAERHNHHPHLVNVWNRVTLRLNTHDAGHRVTALDVKLAGAIDTIVCE